MNCLPVPGVRRSRAEDVMRWGEPSCQGGSERIDEDCRKGKKLFCSFPRRAICYPYRAM